MLDLFNVRNGQTILRVNGDGEVVVFLVYELLDVAILVSLGVNIDIDSWEIIHGERGSLDKERKEGQALELLLQHESKLDQISGVNLILEGEGGNVQSISHGFSHCFFHTSDLLDSIARII